MKTLNLAFYIMNPSIKMPPTKSTHPGS